MYSSSTYLWCSAASSPASFHCRDAVTLSFFSSSRPLLPFTPLWGFFFFLRTFLYNFCHSSFFHIFSLPCFVSVRYSFLYISLLFIFMLRGSSSLTPHPPPHPKALPVSRYCFRFVFIYVTYEASLQVPLVFLFLFGFSLEILFYHFFKALFGYYLHSVRLSCRGWILRSVQ